jgi:eukaryotic translation initiation factor 2C
MPPRATGRGAPPARGTGPAIRGTRGGARGGPSIQIGLPSTNSHITTVGVKRPNFGTGGREIPISVNSFVTTIPEAVIHHYDVVISPSEKTLPARLNMDIIKQLQYVVAPSIFTPRAVYDGRKNMFAARELPFGENHIQEFEVTLGEPRPADANVKPQKAYKITLKKVAEINPEVLQRFIHGEQSHDNNVLTAITALNVVIRMEPTMNYPFNVRSFFTNRETKDIGGGIVLWRGYFQSVRPGVGKMLINVDISTATMYKSGPLLNVCMEFLRRTDPRDLYRTPDREFLKLQRFISGVRVLTNIPGQPPRAASTPRVVKKLTRLGANKESFTTREGTTLTVADYFKGLMNRPLTHPDLFCAEVGTGAKIPLEHCIIPPGQIMRKAVPPEKTKDVLEFATKRPKDRLASIENGLNVLAYGQSEYVRQFGMNVNTSGPLKLQARVLKPPTLRYGAGSKQPTIVPSNGSWNMVDKRFYKPSEPIHRWAVVVFETQNRLNMAGAQDVMRGFVDGCKEVGMTIEYTSCIRYGTGVGKTRETLKNVGSELFHIHNKQIPQFMLVILPEGGNDIYNDVK